MQLRKGLAGEVVEHGKYAPPFRHLSVVRGVGVARFLAVAGIVSRFALRQLRTSKADGLFHHGGLSRVTPSRRLSHGARGLPRIGDPHATLV